MDDAVTTIIEKHKKVPNMNRLKSSVQSRFSFDVGSNPQTEKVC